MEWLNEDTWIISDTHFYHKKIRIYEPTRPINHNETMIYSWNTMVNPNDNILHLGDVILAKKEKMLEIAPLLTGNKYLVKGNHDSRKKLHKLMGFIIPEYTQIKINGETFNVLIKEFGNIKIIFSHKPIHKSALYKAYNVHGHIHTKKITRYDTSQYINMSVEVRGYMPWRLHTILKKIKEKET
jgi:calcineurin-like phosphoesterase family protein